MELEILNRENAKNILSRQKTSDIIHKYQSAFTCLIDINDFLLRGDIDKKTKDEVINTYPNEKYHEFFGENSILEFYYMEIDQDKKNEVYNSLPNEKYQKLMPELFHHLLIFGANTGDEFLYEITSSGVNLEEKKKAELINSFTTEKYCEFINNFESLQFLSMLNIPKEKKNEIINSIPNEKFSELITDMEQIKIFLSFDFYKEKKKEVINSISNEKLYELITNCQSLGHFYTLDIEQKRKQEVINKISNEKYNELFYSADQVDSLLGWSIDEKKKTDIVNNFINSKMPQIGESKTLSKVLDVLALPRMADIKLNIDVMEKIKPEVQKKIAQTLNRSSEKLETEVIKFIQTLENRQCNNNHKPVDFYKWIFDLTQKSLLNANDGIKLSTDEKLSIVKGLSNIHSMDLKKSMSNEFSSIMKDPKQQIQWKHLYNKFLIKGGENKSPSDSSISLSLLLSKHFSASKDDFNDTKYFEKFFNLINGRYIRKYGENSNKIIRTLLTLKDKINNTQEQMDILKLVVDNSISDKEFSKNLQNTEILMTLYPSNFNQKVLTDCFKVGFEVFSQNGLNKLFQMSENPKNNLRETIQAFRSPDAPIVYLTKMNDFEDVKNLFVKFIKSMEDNTFYNKRYDISDSEHLGKVSFHREPLYEEWKKGQVREQIMGKGSKKAFSVEDTDNPVDLFLSGTEVVGSCQNVHGDPNRNKCLMAYVMDGKNRAIIVRDSNSKAIVSRSILRLLMDEKNDQPVLMLEKMYQAPGAPSEHREWIKDMAMERAKMLNIPLVSQSYNNKDSKLYPNQLVSYGSIAPFEYVDSNNEISEGKFVERECKSNTLYNPIQFHDEGKFLNIRPSSQYRCAYV